MYYFVNVRRSVSVGLSVILPRQPDENVTVMSSEIIVLLGVVVPVAVIEQLGASAKVPAGNDTVRASCVPEIVPASVPLKVWGVPVSLSVNVSTSGPVTLLPFWLAVQVTRAGVESPSNASVPVHVPARLSKGVGVGAVGPAVVDAPSQASVVMRHNPRTPL